MTDDFLRRHPEIVEAHADEFSNATGDDRERCAEALAAALPVAFRAHEADLAGDVDGYAAERLAEAVEQYFDTADEEFAENFAAAINKVIAAAYLAGRASMRKDAAAVAYAKADACTVSRDHAAAVGREIVASHRQTDVETATEIATAIRSLP